eukprot:6183351-Pleurochrysis_carterae.AAC.2
MLARPGDCLPVDADRVASGGRRRDQLARGHHAHLRLPHHLPLILLLPLSARVGRPAGRSAAVAMAVATTLRRRLPVARIQRA